MRNLPIITKYYATDSTPPTYMAVGFAAYILFMKSELEDGKYIGALNNIKYTITDDYAATLNNHWAAKDVSALVDAIFKDTTLWDTDLTLLAGFADAVKYQLESLIANGFIETVNALKQF